MTKRGFLVQGARQTFLLEDSVDQEVSVGGRKWSVLHILYQRKGRHHKEDMEYFMQGGGESIESEVVVHILPTT